MITACELCTKITIEKALEEEKLRRDMLLAKKFAENILSPIITNLKEIPNDLFIGYRYHNSYWGLFKGLGNWRTSYTSTGYVKKERHLYDLVRGLNLEDYSELNYEALNKYLQEFGFQISYKTEYISLTQYSSGRKDTKFKIDSLYLSMICPLED